MTDTLALPTTFEQLRSRHRVRARLVALSGLRVGSGKSYETSASDQPVMRDGRGRPFIPGSSLKGALRAGLERVIRGLPHNAALRACDPLDDRDGSQACSARLKRWIDDEQNQRLKSKDPQAYDAQLVERVRREVCTACALFGSSYLAGRIFIRDLTLSDVATAGPVAVEVRDGVGLNRDLRNAQPGIKYDFEALPPGTSFDLELLLENADEVLYALALEALQLLDEGHILIGGLTSRGLGRVALRDVRVERTNAMRLLSGQGFETLDYAAEQARADAVLAARLAAMGA
jgi:CRISPR-associated RAMP protein (TIGR02581 family)